MMIKTKILEHHHSGRLVPHAHTSYAGLMFMLMVCGMVLSLVTQSVLAVPPPPAVGTIGLKGVVPGKAPTTAAVIKVPTNGTRVTEIPVVVSGTCPINTIVEIFKNGIFAGSDYCKDDGTFKLSADLLVGPNDLVAKVYDALDQAGPDSNVVSVTYDPPQTVPLFVVSEPNGVPANYQQLLLRTNAVYRGSFATEDVNAVIDVIGGASPFALIVDWGDGKTDLVSRSNNDSFTATHKFAKPGVYVVIIKGTDARNKTAYLQTTIIINGQSDVASGTAPSSNSSTTKTNIWLAWPMWILLLLIVISFWLGERREKEVLRRRGQLVSPDDQKPAADTPPASAPAKA